MFTAIDQGIRWAVVLFVAAVVALFLSESITFETAAISLLAMTAIAVGTQR